MIAVKNILLGKNKILNISYGELEELSSDPAKKGKIIISHKLEENTHHISRKISIPSAPLFLLVSLPTTFFAIRNSRISEIEEGELFSSIEPLNENLEIIPFYFLTILTNIILYLSKEVEPEDIEDLDLFTYLNGILLDTDGLKLIASYSENKDGKKLLKLANKYENKIENYEAEMFDILLDAKKEKINIPYQVIIDTILYQSKETKKLLRELKNERIEKEYLIELTSQEFKDLIQENRRFNSL